MVCSSLGALRIKNVISFDVFVLKFITMSFGIFISILFCLKLPCIIS